MGRILFNPHYLIYVYLDYVDMRKGHNALYFLANASGLDLLSGGLFLFVSKNRKACIHKKLKRGRFMSFTNLSNITKINSNEFTLILNGGALPLNKYGKKLSFKD